MDASESNYGASSPSGSINEAHQMLDSFWTRCLEEIRSLEHQDFKNQELPLARIKKIMKLDEDVKMISAEAPVLFAKAAELFITELSLRAWVHTEDNKRRTLQKNDIAMAITKYDQFDFLIDIVPRDELKPAAKRQDEALRSAPLSTDNVQYYFSLPQQNQGGLQQHSPTQQSQGGQEIQIVQNTPVATSPNLSIQSSTPTFSMPSVLQVQTVASDSQQQNQQAVQQQQNATVNLNANNAATSQILQLQQGQGGLQFIQQIIGPNGEVQNIPIPFNGGSQLQFIRMPIQGGQGGGGGGGQPILIQASPQQAATAQTLYQLQSGNQVTAGGTPVFLTSGGPGGTQVQIQTLSADPNQDEDHNGS